MRDLLFVTCILISALIALRRPAYGILVFICVSLLSPHSLTWGFGRTFPFAQIIATGTLVGFVFWGKKAPLPQQREFFLLLALWAMYGVSTIFAIEPQNAYQHLALVSKVLLMVCISIFLINTRERVLLLMKVIALSLGFHGLKAGFFALISGGNYMVWGPEGSFLEANNTIGLALAMNVPLLYHLSRAELDWRLRWVERVMFFFSYPATICTFSRGAWLALAAVSGLIILKSQYKVFILASAPVLVLMSLPLLPERVVNRYEDLQNYEEEASAQSRFWNWEFCTRVGLANPLSGGGFDYYSLQAYVRYFPEFLQRWPGKVWSCHSMWFTVLGEHGLSGMTLWLWLMGSCLWSIRCLRVCAKKDQDSLGFHLTDMLSGAFVAYMVGGTFLDVAYFDLYYQLVAIVIMFKECMRRQDESGVGGLNGRFADLSGVPSISVAPLGATRDQAAHREGILTGARMREWRTSNSLPRNR
jgi:probable O-glycosylation ligase (exosortase A-associated)